MGGNALKELQTRRVDRVEYLEIRDYVVGILNALAFSGRVNDIPAYRTKETFGDLDILVETFPDDGFGVQWLRELFDPKQIVKNSNVYSFDYENFQVDLILTPTDEYDTALSYFSWNDLGNLTGRIFKKLGFKYGHKGLSYVFRDPKDSARVISEILMSKDIKKILEFGDLDYVKFSHGFDTVEEMFRWVSASKYFHKDIYLLHNRNNISRTRDKKRKIYNEFLKWCETAQGLPEYPWTEMREQGVQAKPEFVRQAFHEFEGFAERHLQVESRHEYAQRVKKKFNGEVVAKITGLQGKELGEFMRTFIDSVGGKDALVTKYLHATDATIQKDILCFAKQTRIE